FLEPLVVVETLHPTFAFSSISRDRRGRDLDVEPVPSFDFVAFFGSEWFLLDVGERHLNPMDSGGYCRVDSEVPVHCLRSWFVGSAVHNNHAIIVIPYNYGRRIIMFEVRPYEDFVWGGVLQDCLHRDMFPSRVRSLFELDPAKVD